MLRELAKDIDFAIDVTEPREVLLARFEDAIKRALVPTRNVLSAVLHQMEHGEASDSIDRRDEDVGDWRASADDLRWCREQIREILKTLS